MALGIGDTTTPGTDPLASGLGGLYDLFTGVAGTDINRSREAAGLADPFAPQRGQYQDQLSALLKDPNSFKTDPGYQFAKQQGQDAIESSSNALYGTRRTGSLSPELAKFTEGYASQAYDTRIQQLMQLSGANSGSPGTAGTLLQGGFDRNQQALSGGTLGALAPLIRMITGGSGIPGIGSGSGVGGIGGGGSVTNPVPPGATVDASGNVMDEQGNQIGVIDQNGNMVPSYPTDPSFSNPGGPSSFDYGGSSGTGDYAAGGGINTFDDNWFNDIFGSIGP